MMTEAESGMMHLQVLEHQGLPANHRNWEETRKGPHLGILERVWPCCHLDFGLLSLQMCERMNFCCFKHPIPPSLWSFVTVAQGN